MFPPAQTRLFSVGNVARWYLFFLLVQTCWSQTNLPTLPDPALENAILSSQSSLSNLQQLQAQHEATLKTLEQGQQAISLALTQSMDVTVGRLNAMSEMLAAQREKYLEFIRTSNQLMLKADWQSNLAKLEQMQTQHEAKLRAVEQGQQTLAQSLTHSVDTTVARLNAMNDGLVAQREKDLEYIRSSNHLILKVVVGMSGLLFLGIALLALASGRAMKKLNHTVLASPLVHAPPLLDELEDESPNARLTAGRPAQSRKLQLQRVIERLENRIAELENIGPRQLPQEAKSHDNREAREQSPLRLAEAHPTRAPSSLRSSPTGKEGAAIGFAASDVKQTGAQSKKPKLLGRMRKLLSSQPLPKTGDKK